VALGIFLVAYLFIAGARRRGLGIDRVGAALLGAVAMVVLGVVTPDQAFHRAVDADTLLLLLGMMLLSVYLAEAAAFRAAAAFVIRHTRTPRGLLVGVAVVSAVLSAFLVNDTVCLMLTPFVLAVVLEAELPVVPYLLALAMASNAGSVATFTGNPQNMLIGVASGLGYARFAAFMALPAALSVGVVVVVLLFAFRHTLPRAPLRASPHPPVNRRLLFITLAGLFGVMAAFFFGLPMSWSAITGAALVMVLAGHPPRTVLERVDFPLLVFFAGLFVLVFGINTTPLVGDLRHAFAPLMTGSPTRQAFGFSILSVVASNLFSNVPFVMLARAWVPTLPNPKLGWEVLALSSTLAGNLTLIGSVANLIVFEGARGKARLSFWGYLKFGVPVTCLSLVLGLGALLIEHAIFG
jgi:Na+/H+ antiporter NhaD/arsenite permease-like protein